METEEGKIKKSELIEKRKSLLMQLFYIELDDYYAKYNLVNKSIEFSVQFYDNGFNYVKPAKHIQVGHLVLKNNLNCTNDKKSELLPNPEDSRDRRVKQTVGLKLADERTALKIEENVTKTEPGRGSNVKFIFLFKLTETEPVSTRIVYGDKVYLNALCY